MQYSPLAMPPSPAIKVKDEQPTDMLAWLQKTLLGGDSVDQLDPSVAGLLQGLLGDKMAGTGNGTTH